MSTSATASIEQQMEAIPPSVDKLSRDLKVAAQTLTDREARYLVDTYYQMQDSRIRAAGQVRSMKVDAEPHLTLGWFQNQSERLEHEVKLALGYYAKSKAVGRWALSITGIGPVIAAGLLAHINMQVCCCPVYKTMKEEDRPAHDCGGIPSVGHIWRYAGLDPTVTWNKGEKRPWNASLKVLCVKPDSRVTTKRGHLPIEQVVVGDEVLTHLGRWRRVTNTMRNLHDGLIYGLHAANSGNQVAWLTAGHPVYAAAVETWQSGRTHKAKPQGEQGELEFGWHAVEAVKPRFRLCRPVLEEQATEIPVIVLKGVAAGDGLVAAQGRHQGVAAPRAVSVLKEIELSEDMMRLIGLYLAEGHISRTRVHWSFHEDESELSEFVSSMLFRLTGQIAGEHHNLKARSRQISVGCKPLAEAFAALFGTDSYTARFPVSWLSLPDNLLKALWRGVMEGDGDHQGKSENRRISTVSATFARLLTDLGRRIGLSVALHSEAQEKAFRVHVNERDDRTPAARETLVNDYLGFVYNLEVEEDHSYVVEGYAVHNCWKIGEQFVKNASRESDFYGKFYLEKKALFWQKNLAGDYSAQATATLASKKIGKTTDAYKWLSASFAVPASAAYHPDTEKPMEDLLSQLLVASPAGTGLPMLPPAQIHRRATRKATKLFLAHYFETAYRDLHGTEPPLPYPIQILGHVHYIPPPKGGK